MIRSKAFLRGTAAAIMAVLCCGSVFGTTVQVSGRTLLVNGSPFAIKGVCYSPTPVGSSLPSYNWWSEPQTYQNDFRILKSMGANTIRTYNASAATAEALNYAYQNGLYVIMGFWVDPAADFGNETVRSNYITQFKTMVQQYKDYPAVLMWSFGNEAGTSANWYTLLSSAAAAAHQVEGPAYHPVTTANKEITEIGNAGLTADDASQAMDVWGANVYRNTALNTGFFTELQAKTTKPFFLSEWGCDAYNAVSDAEDEAMQESSVGAQWTVIAANLATDNGACLGGTVFEWSDEWWKSYANSLGNSGHDTTADWTGAAYSDTAMNEEWWGIAAIRSGSVNRTLRLSYYTLRSAWYVPPAVSGGSLFQEEVRNFPNPLVAGSGTTRIKCAVSGAVTDIKAELYDMYGRKRLTIPETYSFSSSRVFEWDGKDENGDLVPAGLYICKVTARSPDREEVKYRKIAVVK